MRIWVPGRFEARRSAGGFTLIEILVVMTIIAIGTSIMTLSLGHTADSKIREEARALGRFFNRVADEAAARGETLRVVSRGGSFEVAAAGSPDAPLPTLTLDARVSVLHLEGVPVAPETPIAFPPAGGDVFALTLDYGGARFLIARDALGRIAIRPLS